MKKFFKYFLYVLGTLVIVGVIAYFTWFHNPYEHTGFWMTTASNLIGNSSINGIFKPD